MITVEDYEEIRRAYFVEGLSIRAIQRRLKHDRKTIRKAIVNPVPEPYQLEQAKPFLLQRAESFYTFVALTFPYFLISTYILM